MRAKSPKKRCLALRKHDVSEQIKITHVDVGENGH